jgi:hypothetical protein
MSQMKDRASRRLLNAVSVLFTNNGRRGEQRAQACDMPVIVIYHKARLTSQ